ncbi:MAG: OmpH family outer membrane protein [Bacteroidales bacterium]|nr:OmpH family outer membrane protein [Bacteroidales bacterium]
MKNLVKALFILAIIISSTNLLTAQTVTKFGHIDSNKLIEQMPGRDTVEARITKYRMELQSTIQSMISEYQTKIQEYQANAATMSEIIKQTKEKEIQDLEGRIQQFQQTADQDLQNYQSQSFTPILERAKKAIEDVANENEYTYIFDVGTGALLFYERGDDIMPLVKKKLGI